MPPTKLVNASSSCPCGSTTTLGGCCLPYIEYRVKAPTAEALMRSRYTAHVLHAIDYLWDTWAARERVHSSKEHIAQWAQSSEWLHLDILATEQGGETDPSGIVRFVATFRQQGKTYRHDETSIFERTPEGWLYVHHKD